jgi:hypothetical protein
MIVYAMAVRLARKRPRAKPNRDAPMTASAPNCGQTTDKPAPRKRIACARETKWVVGAPQHHNLHELGHALTWREPADSISTGTIPSITSSPNCGIERATVSNAPREIVR